MGEPGKIVSLAEARHERTPHATGEARCTACKHEWVAVAPVGTIWLQCPSCETERGLYKRHHEPAAGTRVWVCIPCGSYLFTILTDGRCICSGCGDTHFPWAKP